MPERFCYVVNPVGANPEAWKLAFDDLSQIAKDKNYACELGEKMGDDGVRIDRILEKLIKAALVIVDVTDFHDPRVFYLLGIRHTSSNKTILISHAEAQILEDLRPYVIRYSERAAAMREFNKRFGEALDGIEAHPDNPDNPVQAYFQREGQSADLRTRVADLEREVEEARNLIRRMADAQPVSRPSRITFTRVP